MKTRNLSALFVAGMMLICSIQSVAEDPAAINREAVADALNRLAMSAQRYYNTPIWEGGGGGSFASMTLGELLSKPSNANGTFSLSSATATSVQLTGTGREIGFDGSNPLEVECTVYADSVSMTITN